jgi:nucleotide-binding universal stress UspA family protein
MPREAAMTSLSQILVPLDTTRVAEAALPIARLLAADADARLNLVAVSTSPEPGQTRTLYAYLDAMAVDERRSGRRVRTSLRIGDPADAILTLERELEADLIVMATHGRSGLGRLVLGSVAHRVVRAGRAPIVLLRPGTRRVEQLQTVLVPLDGTPGGSLALSMAVPLARAGHARLVLVRASSSNPEAMAVYADSVAASLRRVGLDAEGHGSTGRPAAAILSIADELDADLIVMRTHARGGPLRTLLGSVADEVVRESRRPVMLVRRAAAPHALARACSPAVLAGTAPCDEPNPEKDYQAWPEQVPR